MIDYLKEFEDKGFFTCADILNESEREELLSNIDQIERNVLGHLKNNHPEFHISSEGSFLNGWFIRPMYPLKTDPELFEI